MQAVNLFQLAAQQAQWLAARQSAISGNIANANTPGFKAKDVEPFESIVTGSTVSMTATNPKHMGPGVSPVSFKITETDSGTPVLPSENSVELEQEMIKAGEIRRSFELNTGVVKAFHRMLMMASGS